MRKEILFIKSNLIANAIFRIIDKLLRSCSYKEADRKIYYE
jgi:hypothetical protein